MEGVDCVFVGLSDLSVRLGVPGDMKAPALLDAVARGRLCVPSPRQGPGRSGGKRRDGAGVSRARRPLHCHRRCGSSGSGMRRFVEEVARSVRLTRDQTRFFFDRTIPPIAELASGETIIVETQDAHGGSITSTDTVYRNLDEVFERLGGANPVTGPIAIGGARRANSSRSNCATWKARPSVDSGT